MNSTSATGRWPRGSEWRKWDLHVHSPASSGFAGDWNQFIIQLGNADCQVIGINDYFSVAGYKELTRRVSDPSSGSEGNKAYREALARLRDKTLFPVVECRMTNVVIGKKANTGQRINFHLIFDPAVSVDDIETFIKGLSIKEQSIGTRYADSKFLLNECAVDFAAVRKTLVGDNTFRDRFLIWIPYDEYGGIDDINPETDKLFKEGLVWHADILGSSNKKQSDFFLWKNTKFSEKDYQQWFGRRKPCIKGSDSHNVNDEIGRLKDHNSEPIEKYCWIKADPTFGGLRQVTNEPESRVYVGRLPPKLEDVESNKTRYIASATIRRAHGTDSEHAWFDVSVPLSPDMVAIIGNKGSGKSALADIIALAGNTHCDPSYFSFLTKERFCERNGRIAKDFEVTLDWEDGSPVTRSLNAKPNLNEVERVKYIPQTYLEKVCTETEPGQESEFQSELRKAIFSHISDLDRLGKDTLDDLIAYRTEALREQLVRHRHEVSRVNADIVRLESRATAEHMSQLESQRAMRLKELEAHVGTKPTPVEQPINLPAEEQAAAQAVAAELTREREHLADLEARIVQATARQRTLVEHLAILRRLEGRLTNLEGEFARFGQDSGAELQALGLVLDDIVTVKIDRRVLNDKRTSSAVEKTSIDTNLSDTAPNGLPSQLVTCKGRIKSLQDSLDAPNRRYQRYLEALNTWERRESDLQGSADKANTIAYFEAQLAYVKNVLPGEIEGLRNTRTALARTIHAEIASIRDVYVEMFASVQRLIEESVVIREGFKLTFESSIIDHRFQNDFFDKYINQGVSGSFYSKDKGAVRLEQIRADFDFNKSEDAIAFVQRIVDNLTQDQRSGTLSQTNLADQLRKNATVKDLYDYLWSLEYLEPEYSLRLDGKELNHLSPGERGTLLLVFYLLVDRGSHPIIIDQPEENLDNQTVFKLLIPVIKDVKKRRQLIMVTHSPNIAVVCDAEQIIHAHIDRAGGNRVEYTMGSIEAPDLNLHAINVLEGTRPAFDNRGSKYLLPH